MHSHVLLVYVFKLLQIISTAQVLSTFPNASYCGKKVPSIRLAAIDGRLYCFFYSNTNNFVQLEDTKIKTERCCSMQCTEQTTVVHQSSLGLHCRCCSDQISYTAGLISTNTVR